MLVEQFVGNAPKEVLECGAGLGETAAFLVAAGYRVTALDINEKNYVLLFDHLIEPLFYTKLEAWCC